MRPSIPNHPSRLFPIALLGLAFSGSGCASEFQGRWKGDCKVGLGSNGEQLPIDLELADSGQGTVGGRGSFGYNEATFEGAATGRIVDDESLKVELEGVSGGYVILLELETTMDGAGELDGICAFTDQDTLYEGDVVLSAVGG